MIASPHTKLSQSLPVLKLSPRKPTTQDAIVSPDLLNPRKVQFFTLDTVAKDRELGLQTARIRENIEDSTKQPLSQTTERIEKQRQRRCTPYPVKHETKARIAEGPIVSFQEEGLEMGDAATEQAAERIEKQRQRRCTPYPVKHETKARIAEGLIVSFQEKVEEKVVVVDADGLIEEDPRVEHEKMLERQHRRRCTPLPVRLGAHKVRSVHSLAAFDESHESMHAGATEEGSEDEEQEHDEVPIFLAAHVQEERTAMVKRQQQRRCTPLPGKLGQTSKRRVSLAPLREQNEEAPAGLTERRPTGWAALSQL